MATSTSTEELISGLQRSTRGRRFRGGKGVDWLVFGVAAVVAIGFVT